MSGDTEEEFFQNPGAGGTGDSMDARVTRLETHTEYMRADLAEIKAGQKLMQESIHALSQSTQESIQKLAQSTQDSVYTLTLAIEKVSTEAKLSEGRLRAEMKELPTKNDLRNYQLQAIGIGIAVLILVVTGIAGGLIFIKNG